METDFGIWKESWSQVGFSSFSKCGKTFRNMENRLKEDMKYDSQELPRIFFEDNIEIDLIDNDVMNHLEDFTLEKLYK